MIACKSVLGSVSHAHLYKVLEKRYCLCFYSVEPKRICEWQMIFHYFAASCAVSLCGKVKNILWRSNCSSQRPVSACARLLHWIKRQPRSIHKHGNLWLICPFYKHRSMFLLSSTLVVSPAGTICVYRYVYRGHTTSSPQAFWFFLFSDRLSVTWTIDFFRGLQQSEFQY